MHTSFVLLASTGRITSDKSGRLFADVVPWLILLIGVVLAGAVVIYFIRRYLRSDDPHAADGFTLHDLREMHEAGDLTDAEFQRAKAAMIGRLRTAPDDSSGTPGEGSQAGPESGAGPAS